MNREFEMHLPPSSARTRVGRNEGIRHLTSGGHGVIRRQPSKDKNRDDFCTSSIARQSTAA